MTWDTPPQRSGWRNVLDAAAIIGIVGVVVAVIGIWIQHHDTTKGQALFPTPTPSLPGASVQASPLGEGSASPAPPPDPACLDTATHGALDVGEGTVAGGPNLVRAPCTSIYLRLTQAAYTTYARSCVEDQSGATTIGCSGWVQLSPGHWDTLSVSVASGSRWRLEMYADADEHAKFTFTG